MGSTRIKRKSRRRVAHGKLAEVTESVGLLLGKEDAPPKPRREELWLRAGYMVARDNPRIRK
jgi:hypothetical protein